MTLNSIYSTQTSRYERLSYFSHAIEKEQGWSLAFQSLDKKDRIAVLALCNISSSKINWNKIGKQKLKNAVKQLVQGAARPNLLQLPPQEMTKAHLTPFLAGKDLANLQSAYKAASELGSATSIIKSYALAPLIAKYCHRYCDTLTEDEKIKVLNQLMSLVKDLSELEHLEVPSYQSIGKFFELVEARNLLRFAQRMHIYHPLAGLENEQLEIPEDSEGTLQSAEKIREWFREHRPDLRIFVRLNLFNLTLLPAEIGQLEALRELDLTHNHLTNLPKEIGQLRSLTHLWLNNNHLTSLPKEIGRLRALTGLWLAHNRLTSLPKEIGQLANLWLFNISDNHLTSLPKVIGQLRALNYLDLGNNHLKGLPKEIGQLRALITIVVSYNRLTSLPKEIGQLKALEYLGIGNNRLTNLPKEIGQLGALTGLDLNHNYLTRVSKVITQLGTLQNLHLNNNRLIHLPKEIGRLRALKYLYLENNRLTDVPKEIRQLKALKLLYLHNNRLTSLPKEIISLRKLYVFILIKNGLIDLPAELKRFSTQLENQNKTLQMKTILGRLKRCLKAKHDCEGIAALLDKIEKFHGKEMRSKLHGCIYEVCKEEKALHKKVKSSHFGRKAFIDPTIAPKFKLTALERFEHILKEAQNK